MTGNEIIRAFETDFDKAIKTEKSEAIKDFSQRLKELKIRPEYPWDDYYVTEDTINSLVKEMTEEING